ncbi:MAG: polysaccharide deacetylase family protein [Candidatus Hodarchaeales archaeon]|jgi:peptidoglycan/xylan/chitin deacetylase (PgdA/CDA1 family)
MKDVFICLTVDLERDIGVMPSQYKGIDNGFPFLFDIFKDRGIKTTWMLASKVLEDRGKVLKKCATNGHEIAGHGYKHELYLPSLRLPVAEYESLGFKLKGNEMDIQPFEGFNPLPFENRETAFEIIDRSTSHIENFFGKQPTSFKMPYTTVDWEVLRYLDSLGYLVDVSIPHWKYWDWRPPHHPYIHKMAGELEDSLDLNLEEQKESLTLLEIPMSCDPHPEIANSMMVMHRTFSMLTCRTLGMKRIEALLDRVTHRTPENQPIIFAFKSSIWEFAEMQKVGYRELEENMGQEAIDLMNQLIDLLNTKYAPTYLTLTELAGTWEKNHCPIHSSK